MRLVHPDLHFQIVLDESQATKLVIENPRIFTAIVQELLVQSKGDEGRFVLSENNKILSICDNIMMIINPFSIDYNERKIVSKLYGKLKSEIQTEFSIVMNQLLSGMIHFIEQVIDTVDYPLNYTDNIDINAFLKLMEIKILVTDEDLPGQVMEYIRIMNQLLCYTIFVFVNFNAYLDISEITQLYEYAMYQKIYLLMIECSMGELRYDNERIYIIDRDGCEIY
jgi:CRISPR-associated protein Csn2